MADITAKIYLKDGRPVTLGKRQIKKVESLSQSTSDPSTIYYGAVASTGSIDILDVDGTIKEYIDNGLIDDKNLSVELYANNKLFQKCLSNNNDYDNQTQTLTLRLTNELSKWSEIKLDRRQLSEECSAFDLLVEVLNSVGYSLTQVQSMCQGYAMQLDNTTTGTVKDLLESIKISYPYLEAGSLIQQINKICNLAQLWCIQDDNGEIKFISARPVYTVIGENINIPKNKQYSTPKYTLITHNKIEDVGYSKLEYEYLFKSVENSNITVFPKNVDSKMATLPDGSSKLVYSGLFSDYNKEITIENENFEISEYGAFPDESYNGDRFLTLKATIKNNEISKKDSWRIMPSTFNANVIVFSPLGIVPTSSTKYGLENSNGTFPFSSYVNTPYIQAQPCYVVITQNEAISGLRTWADSHSNNEQYSSPIYIIYNADGSITLYSAILYAWGQSNYVQNYTGNLINIYLDYVISVFQRVLSQKTAEEINPSADFIIPSNELIAVSTYYEKDKRNIYDRLEASMLRDYRNGISNCSVTISCADYFNNENKVVDWDKGEIIKVGDILELEGVEKTWKVTGRKLRKSGVPFIDLELMEVKEPPTLQSMSWGEIAAIANKGLAEEYFKVGDEKTFTFTHVDGYTETITVAILGFNHDTISGTDKKANITFGMTGVVGYRKGEWGDMGSAAEGWVNSTARQDLENIVFSLLPKDLQSVIKTVKKECGFANDATALTYSNDRLWLLSAVEVTGTANAPAFVNINEGTQYKYWRSVKDGSKPEDRIKYWTNHPEIPSEFWSLRSVSTQNIGSWVLFQDGYFLRGQGIQLYNSFCFCI